jgi:hypothetical protein
VVGLLTLKREPPQIAEFAAGDFYRLVCEHVGVEHCAQLYVFLLDAERGVSMLCARTRYAADGAANWIASSLARTVVYGNAVLIRGHSLIARNIYNYSHQHYTALNKELNAELRGLENLDGLARTRWLRQIRRKPGGSLHAMVRRELEASRALREITHMRRSSAAVMCLASLDSDTDTSSSSSSESSDYEDYVVKVVYDTNE